MKVHLNFIASCFALLSTGLHAQAEGNEEPKGISIGSMSIPFAYEENGDGVYNEILDQLIAGYPGKVKATFFPSNRLDRAIEARQVDCTYITTANIAKNAPEDSAYRDMRFVGPVNTVSVVIYVQHDADNITDLSQLKGLRVASDVNLVPLANRLGIDEDFALQSQLQMIEMLVADRVDVLIGYDFDLDFLTRKQGVRDRLKKSPVKLWTIGDGIACFDNDKNALFLDHIEQRFKEISDSGWLDEALKEYR